MTHNGEIIVIVCGTDNSHVGLPGATALALRVSAASLLVCNYVCKVQTVYCKANSRQSAEKNPAAR